MKNNFDLLRWVITNRTNESLRFKITGVSLSPVRQDCIVLYTKLPDEVEHLNIPVRQSVLDYLGVETAENVEEDYPLILLNKSAPKLGLRGMNKYAFFRNFRRNAGKSNIDVKNIHSARHLIGKQLETRLIQMRRVGTEQRFWAPDRVDLIFL